MAGESKMKDKMNYWLEIKPALVPEHRHAIEDVIKSLGYRVSGGGTHTDMSCCDISFYSNGNTTEGGHNERIR